jgi:phosphoserine phosphatase
MAARRLVLFDVCNTLYDVNTTFGFVRHVVGQGLRLPHRSSPLYWPQAVLYRLGIADLPRRRTLAALAGCERAALEAVARAYVTGPLAARAIPATQARLAEHRAAGDRVVLISNSLDVVAAAIAEQLGTEWRASRLGFAEGRCTGRLEADLTGRKLDVARALASEMDPAPERLVYTDNLSDRPLVDWADKAVVILPPRARRAAWAGVRAEFLETAP